MTVYTRIVLATLSLFNALMLTLLGAGALFAVNGSAGPIVTTCLWSGAVVLFGLSRRLRKGTEWG